MGPGANQKQCDDNMLANTASIHFENADTGRTFPDLAVNVGFHYLEFRDRRLSFPDESVPLEANPVPPTGNAKYHSDLQGGQEEEGALKGWQLGDDCNPQWGPIDFGTTKEAMLMKTISQYT